MHSRQGLFFIVILTLFSELFSMNLPMKKIMGTSFVVGALPLAEAVVNYVACKDVSQFVPIDQMLNEVVVTTTIAALITAPFFYGLDIKKRVSDLELKKTKYLSQLRYDYKEISEGLKEYKEGLLFRDLQESKKLHQAILRRLIIEKQVSGLRLNNFNAAQGEQFNFFDDAYTSITSQRSLFSSGMLPVSIISSTTILGSYFNLLGIIEPGLVASYITLGLAAFLYEKQNEDFKDKFEQKISDEIYKKNLPFNKEVEEELSYILSQIPVKRIKKQNGIIENRQYKIKSRNK